jgi:hypothetical protein
MLIDRIFNYCARSFSILPRLIFLKKIIFLSVCFLFLLVNRGWSEITFQDILENPSDLELNLQYAKEQEQAGKYKNTIASLERLNMLYPVNTDIKIYLLSILLKMDSVAKLQLTVNTMLQDPNTTQEARNYIEEILKTIEQQQAKTKTKSKWFAYADLSYTHTENSNIEGMSKTGTFQQFDPSSELDIEQDFRDDTIMYDKTFSRAGSITVGKNIDSTSAFSVTGGITTNTQNKGDKAVNDLSSVSLSYSKILGKHYILPYVYYSRPNYRNDQEDLVTKGIGFSNNYIINNNNTASYGFGYADTSIDTTSRHTSASTPDLGNNGTFTGSVGYNYTFSKINLISSTLSYTNKNAVADHFSYAGPGLNVNYTRVFSFGNFKIGRNFYKNAYDEKEAFFNTSRDRTDKTRISTAQLTGKFTQILPFFKKMDPKGQLYYNVKYTETDTNSTMTNYGAIRKNTSFNIIKRFSLYE